MLAGCGIRLSSIRRVPGLMPSHTVTWVASGGSARRARTDAGSPADCTAGHSPPHQHRLRRIHLPPLLQPGVPGNADVGEHRHLFPAQTRRAPAAHQGNPRRCGSRLSRRARRKAPAVCVDRPARRSSTPVAASWSSPLQHSSANTSIDRNWYPFNLSVMLRRSAE